MVFLKSLAAGLVGLAGYLVLLGVALWYGPILWLHWQMWRARGEGAAAAGFSFGISPLLLFQGLLVFAAAFWWEWGRAAR